MGLGSAVKAMAIFLIIELFMLGFSLLLMGAFTPTPLALVTALCTNAGITPNDLAIGLFIIGTFVNLIIMFIIAAQK